MTARIKTVCCRCGRLIHDGLEAPGGGVSHGFCVPCADAWRKEAGLPPMTPEQVDACRAGGEHQ